MNRGNSVRYYSSLLRKIILIIGDIICLYLATSIAMVLELGNKQTDKIAFHLEFLPILVIMMFFMFNVYGLFSLIRKKLVDIFLNLLVAVTNIYIIAMAMTFFFRQFDYSRVVLVYSAVFSFVLLAIWQYICHQWEWKHFPKQTAVLFAAGEEAARIQNKLAKTYGLEDVYKRQVYSSGISQPIERIWNCWRMVGIFRNMRGYYAVTWFQ